MVRVAWLLIIVVLPAACSHHEDGGVRVSGPRPAPTASLSAPPTPSIESYTPDQVGDSIGDLVETFTEDDTLFYGGYELVRLKRPDKTQPSNRNADIDYAVLRRQGRTIAKFDGIDTSVSSIRFGLFAFLGDGEQQLVVEQTSLKWWRYWVISLKPTVRIIYDSGEYNAVYEMRVADLDNDGQPEIIQNLGAFWYFDSLNNVNSPRPPIVFKFQSRTAKYLPANPSYQTVTLADIDARAAKVVDLLARKEDPFWHRQNVLSAALDVVLRYLYSGKAKEAWAFFEQSYTLEDRPTVRSAIVRDLRKDRYYRAITAAAEP